MNVSDAPTLVSLVVSFFRKRVSPPVFTPVVPAKPTEVFVTCDTTTHVDPPEYIGWSTRAGGLTSGKNQTLPLYGTTTQLGKLQPTYPQTPGAPNPYRTTFLLPLHDWDTAEFVGGLRCDADQAQTSFPDIDLDIPPGHTLLCHPTEPGVYAVAEPKTLARMLFFLGFLLPPFWLVGSAIICMPLRTTADWEAGKSRQEIEWGCSVIRNTELRWARRCLFALLLEVIAITLVVAIIKWGITAPV